MNSSFHEATDKKIALPEDDVEVFKVYYTWLNSGELRYTFGHDDEKWCVLGSISSTLPFNMSEERYVTYEKSAQEATVT
ncbi:MAG: hypothetical protein Q9218_006173 [Villophora microphyllina]